MASLVRSKSSRPCARAMPTKLIWFNGIWAFDQSVIDAQAELLQYADGASVEFYGYDDNGKITTGTFERIVQPINAMLEAHPDKPILVRGTSLHGTFLRLRDRPPERTLLLRLLPPRKNTRLILQLRAEFPDRADAGRAHGGRSALLWYFRAPARPADRAAVANGTGGWSRKYEGGQVFVAPAEGNGSSST